MNVIVVKSRSNTRRTVVFITKDDVGPKAIRAKLKKRMAEERIQDVQIDVFSGDEVEVCSSPVAVAEVIAKEWSP